MFVTLIVAGLLIAGMTAPAAAVVGLALVAPAAAAVLGTAIVFRRWSQRGGGRPLPVDESVFLAAIAAELRAGAALRHSLSAAADRVEAPGLRRVAASAVAGLPASRVADHLEHELGVHGRKAAFAFAIAAETGGGAATAFARLSARAVRFAELKRERAALTAQARLSASVVALAPVAAVVALFGSGRVSLLLESGHVGVVVMFGGLTLVGSGLVIVFAMIRLSGR